MYSRRDFSRLGLALAGGFATLKAISGFASEASAEDFEITKSDDEWKKELTPEQYNVLRKHGTERAGTSPLDQNDAAGTYLCAGCQLALFSSDTKFHSGTGWPSFWKPLDNAVATEADNSYFMRRTEVHCRRCGGHLGHVFDDGPKPTGLRYCMNGVALKFEPKLSG
ncbi:peptide-methionine (R)-S-oxide reductase MsrB [Hyphomicrobium sp.]|uniref:peptide-methionine (R)-S-oxide reductase MsrB n=1 Tax=Hyphomicrobium sp. TaxID=82 RepID=UPI002D781C87|nr:peptide-methionine (R)-S-oxide reductase MsrB [Hyphomicrobium sp.]HET6389419.1 peptide-methionine (R)-S-oxide reductase MsrB [Hyphomicrobium sp.]